MTRACVPESQTAHAVGIESVACSKVVCAVMKATNSAKSRGDHRPAGCCRPRRPHQQRPALRREGDIERAAHMEVLTCGSADGPLRGIEDRRRPKSVSRDEGVLVTAGSHRRYTTFGESDRPLVAVGMRQGRRAAVIERVASVWTVTRIPDGAARSLYGRSRRTGGER